MGKKYCYFVIILLLAVSCEPQYIINRGLHYGTTYSIIYKAGNNSNYHHGIDSVLRSLDASLSTYKPYSTISRINKNESDIRLDSLFINCFQAAKKVYKATDGAFDITVAPLVNLWGFGFENKGLFDTSEIADILDKVGMDKVVLKEGRVIKKYNEMLLDASAIAKGYAVDLTAAYLEKHKVDNYMIEIGGEIRVKGVNPKNKKWKIGIEKPIYDSLGFDRELEHTIAVTDRAIATSGNYRNYYIKNDKIYSHTIQPKTGYPIEHNLLSVTVFSDQCMISDAYATAFMVLGVEKSIELAKKNSDIDILLLYNDSRQNDSMYVLKTYMSENIKNAVVK